MNHGSMQPTATGSIKAEYADTQRNRLFLTNTSKRIRSGDAKMEVIDGRITSWQCPVQKDQNEKACLAMNAISDVRCSICGTVRSVGASAYIGTGGDAYFAGYFLGQHTMHGVRDYTRKFGSELLDDKELQDALGALDEDYRTPRAHAIVFYLADFISEYEDENGWRGETAIDYPAKNGRAANVARAWLLYQSLGLLLWPARTNSLNHGGGPNKSYVSGYRN